MNTTDLRFADQSSSSSFSISWRVWMSSAENGSSIRMICGIEDQRLRERHALAHAAGELVRIAVAEAAQADALQPLVGARASLRRARRRGTPGPRRRWRSAVRQGISASVWNR